MISWDEFVRRVKEFNKTADEDGVRNVAFYLNESAEVRRNVRLGVCSDFHLLRNTLFMEISHH